MYVRLGDCVPKMLHSLPGILVMEYLRAPNLLDVLEMQEKNGFDPAPWRALRGCLRGIHGCTGMTPEDGNLRNFLWDGGRIAAVDLEHYRCGQPEEAALRIAAFVLEYRPKDTPLKKSIAECLAKEWAFSEAELQAEREKLQERRRTKADDRLGERFSMILLAGGNSVRMGRDKAELPFFGSTLVEFQMEKAQLLGIDDLMISGTKQGFVADILPDRGPLGGLHACMARAKHPYCIVLPVDAPLVPASVLRNLAQMHLQGGAQATVLRHEGKLEPLIGVYDTTLAEVIRSMILKKGRAVHALLDRIAVRAMDADGSEELWRNYNTPDEYERLIRR